MNGNAELHGMTVPFVHTFEVHDSTTTLFFK